jgi:hypothetical protein
VTSCVCELNPWGTSGHLLHTSQVAHSRCSESFAIGPARRNSFTRGGAFGWTNVWVERVCVRVGRLQHSISSLRLTRNVLLCE